MHSDSLPDTVDALVSLESEIRAVLYLGSNELNRLVRLADGHQELRPLTCLGATKQGGMYVGSEIIGFLNPMGSGAEVNHSLVEIATLAQPILKYLSMSVSDRAHIEGLASSKAGSSLLLEGMIQFVNAPPLAEEVVEMNRLRLTALRGLLERLTAPLTELSAKVVRKLHPPEVKDRVRVNVEDRVLNIDGVDYELNTSEQARVLEQMAKANGEPLSGPEIVRRAGLKEGFMVSRTLNQIKTNHPKLGKFIPLARDTAHRFCFRLPPLA
ncbi:MAG: hypothetical protein C0467_12650 [Planctomycetaceae bacterium]|nr:hypothetical protein [Planctomycetaceae bacterium]